MERGSQGGPEGRRAACSRDDVLMVVWGGGVQDAIVAVAKAAVSERGRQRE